MAATKQSDPIHSNTSPPSQDGEDAVVAKAQRGRAIGELLGRELSARTILFHQAVAERMGLSVTDHKCLDIAWRGAMDGHLTAGRMAELTGLTTGAITGVLDRLEKAGFVRREKDPNDRRQVLVRFLPDRVPDYVDVFTPFAQAWEDLYARYTDDELSRVEHFFRTSLALIEKETERVRNMAPPRKAAPQQDDTTELSAPLSPIGSGYLEIVRGSSGMRIYAETGPFLYRGHFGEPAPRITAHEGHVVVQPARTTLRGLVSKRTTSELGLHPSVPWHVAVRGGVTKFDADLRALTLRAFEISGGVQDLSVKLPRPTNTVLLSIRGGAQRATFLRPEGVAARLTIKSGASGLTLDTLHLGAVGGKTDWSSPDFADARDRYEIEILGGADQLTVGTLPPTTYPTRDE